MKSAINKICTKLGSSFNVNDIWLLTKQRFPRSFCNVTNIQKPIKKPNLFRKPKNDASYASEEKIGIIEYSFLALPICAFALGTWQIQRLQWKLNLVEKLKSNITQEPIELPENLENLESKEYHPIKVRGTFLYDKEFIVGHRSLLKDGKPTGQHTFVGASETQRGYHVITPFKLADRELTILVNRGWIPRSLKNPAKRQKTQENDEVEVVGILRLNERKPPFVPKNRPHGDIWYYRDLDAMAQKGETSPIYIEMLYNNSEEYPIGGQTKVELRNEHLSYVLTWYCLSASTAYIWYRKFTKGIPFTA